MPWNIKKIPFSIPFVLVVLYPIALVLAPFSRMVTLSINIHILDIVCALLIFVSCLKHFWGEAALAAVYTINHMPSPIISNQSFYECLYGVPLFIVIFEFFGCACFVLLQFHEHTKLEPLACLCFFLGYGIEHKWYRFLNPYSKRLCISRCHFMGT